jgi:Holliday junction resolvase
VNTKAKGSRAEHRTMALLESAGYACSRSAASLGVFDVIGVSSVDIVLVQVKAGSARPGSTEMEAIKLFPAPPNARKLVHRWRDRQRLPDVREV